MSGVPLWWGRGKRTLDLRKYAAELLESRETHIIVISLTLLDLCIVLTELVLAGFYPEHEHRPPAVERAEEALSWTSIAILSLFTIEQLLKLAVFGIQYFFHIWHALDAVIIVASLVLESVLRGTTQEAVSLLVVFRLWRLVRVLHSTAETMVLRQEDMLEEHHRLVKDLEQVRWQGGRMAPRRLRAQACAGGHWLG